MFHPWQNLRKRAQTFLRRHRLDFGRGLLLLALVQGLIYTTLIPPWWNYDEPKHFWRAWMLARGPIPEEAKPRMVESLLEHEWFRVYPKYVRPSVEEYARFPEVLYPSGRWSRLFYWYFVSLPLRVIPEQWDLAWQLRALRGMSLLLFVATIWVAWQAARELFGPRHPLARLMPLSLALLPGFAEPMSLLNDDVGAALGGTLFVWAVIRLLRRGLSWRTVAFALLAAGIASQMKRTVIPMLAVLPFALILAWRPRRARWLPWALAGGLLVGAAWAVLGWGDPAHWYHDRLTAEPLRAQVDPTPDGQWVLRVPSGPIEVGQWLPRHLYREYPEGTPLRLTFWMWSDKPGKVRLPKLCVSGGGIWKPEERCTPDQIVRTDTAPQAYTLTLPVLEGEFARLEFYPFTGAKVGFVYADGFSLRPEDAPQGPEMLRNGSFEEASVRLKPIVGRALPAGSVALPVVMAAWQEPELLLRALRPAVSTLFKTFWGLFARAKIPYLGEDGTYAGLLALTVLGVLGAGWTLLRERRRVPWNVVVVLGLSTAIVWFMAVSFVLGYLHEEGHSLTWFRYAFPAAFPTVAVLVVGWYALLRPRGQVAAMVRFLLWLNLLAWWSIGYFFYTRVAQFGFLLAILILSALGWPRGVERWLEETPRAGPPEGPSSGGNSRV